MTTLATPGTTFRLNRPRSFSNVSDIHGPKVALAKVSSDVGGPSLSGLKETVGARLCAIVRILSFRVDSMVIMEVSGTRSGTSAGIVCGTEKGDGL